MCKGVKEMINKMNLVSYNKRRIVQKTWNDDSDSDDDFQKDLEKETKEEFYKKIALKEKLALEYEENSETISSSSIKKIDIKTNKQIILKHDTVSSSSEKSKHSKKSDKLEESEEYYSNNTKDIFIDIYNN